ncbi:sulfur carrier protein ThiS [Sulfurimonas sp.]
MNIVVNGEEKELKEGISLFDLLQKLSLENKVMAAAINMEIVKQNSWKETILKDGDKLELLDFVGGG